MEAVLGGEPVGCRVGVGRLGVHAHAQLRMLAQERRDRVEHLVRVRARARVRVRVRARVKGSGSKGTESESMKVKSFQP